MLSLSLGAPALVLGLAAAPLFAQGMPCSDACSALASEAPEGTIINGTEYVSAGTNLTVGYAAQGISNENVTADFCQVKMTIVTSPTSSAYTEVWLPTDWTGRFLTAGNGGWAGQVTYSDLNDGVGRGMASVSTNTGHDSLNAFGTPTWSSNPQAVFDFGYRALEESIVAAKALVNSYYGQPPSWSYYRGCSTGGRQGLLEAQRYADEFDGILVGSPAYWMSHLQAWTIRIQLSVAPVNSSQWISPELWTYIHAEILSQCDALDGVADGIVSDPQRCHFRPEAMLCVGDNTVGCLNSDQVKALYHIYNPFVSNNQTYIFGGYYPGGELLYPYGLVGPQIVPIGPNYYQYLVLNNTDWDPATLNYSDIELAEKINPGQQDATSPNLTAFMDHGGKMMHYAGWSDQLISPGSSLYYYNSVLDYYAGSTVDVSEFYRLFMVPGMGHCGGGNGPSNFAQSGTSPPLHNNSEYDALLALIEWREAGTAPTQITGYQYNNVTASSGVNLTRPFCMYPNDAVYCGSGSVWEASSWSCPA